MTFILDQQQSIANQFLADLRNVDIQQDRMRFRRNLERIGELLAYEISKQLSYKESIVETPLGEAHCQLPTDKIVLATILRAGVPLHQGMLNIFDNADNAFISAYRKHHKDGTFEISVEYISCPDLQDTTLIISDPMLATGSSMGLAIKELLKYGHPKELHIATVIAASAGLEHLQRLFPDIHVWMGSLDEELTAKSYIVPGLGDAGDLAFGPKMQH